MRRMNANTQSGGNDDMAVETVNEEGKEGPISTMVEEVLSPNI